MSEPKSFEKVIPASSPRFLSSTMSGRILALLRGGGNRLCPKSQREAQHLVVAFEPLLQPIDFWGKAFLIRVRMRPTSWAFTVLACDFDCYVVGV